MAAALNFLAGRNGSLVSLAGSGLGFFGATFGASVQVSSYPDSTYITDATGAAQGPAANNTKYAGTASGVALNGLAPMKLIDLPNLSGTLNLRFTYDSPVKTQNAVVYVYDRANINNDPSGVTCQVAQLIHPWDGPAAGSGNATWVNVHGSGQTLALLASPGMSGLSPSGPDTTDTRHDWYLAMSTSPNSIGSKTQFGLYAMLEYL